MKVLIAGEYSGKERDSFIALGHDAISCDLLESEKPGPHYQGDMADIIPDGWDLIIMHPPCTAMAVSGNRWYGKGMPLNNKRIDAVEWTLRMWSLAKAHAKKAALENPVSVIFSHISDPVQYIQPWQFGHGETKKTGLALHNLRPLTPTNIVEGREQRIWKMPPSADRGKKRSEAYDGIAKAMAAQWGE